MLKQAFKEFKETIIILNSIIFAPSFYVGGKDDPYLLRWYITPWSGWFRNIKDSELRWYHKLIRGLPNIYLHKFLRDDDDRALHDHPWHSLSIVLAGGYKEHVFVYPSIINEQYDKLEEKKVIYRKPGNIIFRKATHAHRVELYNDLNRPVMPPADQPAYFMRKPAWTIFITGPKLREWGFYCPKKWTFWRDFVSETDHGNVGKGCAE